MTSKYDTDAGTYENYTKVIRSRQIENNDDGTKFWIDENDANIDDTRKRPIAPMNQMEADGIDYTRLWTQFR